MQSVLEFEITVCQLLLLSFLLLLLLLFWWNFIISIYIWNKYRWLNIRKTFSFFLFNYEMNTSSSYITIISIVRFGWRIGLARWFRIIELTISGWTECNSILGRKTFINGTITFEQRKIANTLILWEKFDISIDGILFLISIVFWTIVLKNQINRACQHWWSNRSTSKARLDSIFEWHR